MSTHTSRRGEEQSDDDPWERLAEYEGTLEMLVEEDVEFADDAESLLETLEQEGYR